MKKTKRVHLCMYVTPATRDKMVDMAQEQDRSYGKILEEYVWGTAKPPELRKDPCDSATKDNVQ